MIDSVTHDLREYERRCERATASLTAIISDAEQNPEELAASLCRQALEDMAAELFYAFHKSSTADAANAATRDIIEAYSNYALDQYVKERTGL